MGRFRKRAVVVEAERWWAPGHVEHVPIDGVERGPREDQGWGVMTLEGFMRVGEGDWIITGVKGEKYPCRDDVFAATYDAVGDGVGFVSGVLASQPERVEEDDGN